MAKKRRSDEHIPEAAPQAAGSGISRRGFLTTAGVSALGAAAVPGLARARPAADAEVVTAADAGRVHLRINGQDVRLLVEPRESLLHVLRERLGLTGTKVGCDRGECGACTVLIGDLPRYSCLTLALEADGAEITTVEGLLEGEELGTVQQAFVENDAFQCGYCTPGQICAVEGLLRRNPEPSLDQIRVGVSGNLCRCGAYPNIFRAAARAADLRRAGGGS